MKSSTLPEAPCQAQMVREDSPIQQRYALLSADSCCRMTGILAVLGLTRCVSCADERTGDSTDHAWHSELGISSLQMEEVRLLGAVQRC